MNCFELASTGTPVGLILLIGAGCVLPGLALVVIARRARRRDMPRRAGAKLTWALATVVVALLVGATTSVGAALPSGCGPASPVPGGDTLTIVQTSTNDGLAPGVAPSALTGVITNRGLQPAFVTAVTVSIAAIEPTSALGLLPECSAGDYLLIDPRMLVGRLLLPGQSLAFSGAAIGFRSSTTNQDGCKLARVVLGYVSS